MGIKLDWNERIRWRPICMFLRLEILLPIGLVPIAISLPTAVCFVVLNGFLEVRLEKVKKIKQQMAILAKWSTWNIALLLPGIIIETYWKHYQAGELVFDYWKLWLVMKLFLLLWAALLGWREISLVFDSVLMRKNEDRQECDLPTHSS